LDGIGAATVKVAVATTTAPDPSPNLRDRFLCQLIFVC